MAASATAHCTRLPSLVAYAARAPEMWGGPSCWRPREPVKPPPPHSMKKLLEILQTGDVVHFGNAVGSCKIFFFSPSLGVTRRRDSRAI